ncbi:hypothetical protein BaRGS_00029364 [Batillaria attramentaria]|uniref:Uncharacterized protein n=1 Tax=Batillaria attramentaria TaxID=370345 RepID=A0ABD0JXG0_9CAEN
MLTRRWCLFKLILCVVNVILVARLMQSQTDLLAVTGASKIFSKARGSPLLLADFFPSGATNRDEVGFQNEAPEVEKLPVARDVRAQEPWPDVERKAKPSEQLFETVHLMWCGKKILELRHYLSILSVFRVVQPLKIVMHYTDLPGTNMYHTWFTELVESLPILEMHQLPSGFSCESTNLLMTALHFLSQSGGVYIGENTILTRYPEDPERSPLWSACSNSSYPAEYTVMFARGALNTSEKERYLKSVPSSEKTCSMADSNQPTPTQRPECLTLDKTIFPRDFLNADTPFAEFARWLFYGRRAPNQVETEGAPIPRISHYVRFKTLNRRYRDELTFQHFLSVLSALYIGGFEHVYVHGDAEPVGPLWEELLKENVTFVEVVAPRTVYQREIRVTEHRSDVTRYLVLYKYGGAYQDWDVMWMQKVPESLLANPAVICTDWNTRGWPDLFNNGVMLTRPRSHWLHHFLATHRNFRDGHWSYNSLMMSYRTMELYPRTVYLDRRLQVICHQGQCHPTWLPGYAYGEGQLEPARVMREARAIHVTAPKPPSSLASLEATKGGQDLYASMAKFVLERSGRKHMLD